MTPTRDPAGSSLLLTTTARPHRPWLREAVDVAATVPLFLTAPLLRPWHRRWGATDVEVAAALPGDDLVPGCLYRTTRAITIAAPPAQVWPWLVQVGFGRAGFYSLDLLDNLGRPSAQQLLPQFQGLRPGQWVPMSPTPSDRTAFRVHSFEESRWLLWAKPDSTWCWSLTDLGNDRTRLVTRIRTRYDWTRPAAAVFGVLLMEVGDFAMVRRMLRGIRDRAEHPLDGHRRPAAVLRPAPRGRVSLPAQFPGYAAGPLDERRSSSRPGSQ
jgi:hypothetical protein